MYVTDITGTYKDPSYSNIYGWRSAAAIASDANRKKKNIQKGNLRLIDFANPEIKHWWKKVREYHWKTVTYYKLIKVVNGKKFFKRITESRKYYNVVEKPQFYVSYPKVDLPVAIWCLKLQDFDMMPHLYEDKQKEYAEYVRKALRGRCSDIKEPKRKSFYTKREGHSCFHKKRSGGRINDDPVFTRNYTIGGITFTAQSPLEYASDRYDRGLWCYRDTTRVDGERIKTQKIVDMRPQQEYDARYKDDIINEAWPCLENLSTPTDALELYLEGLPVKTKKYDLRKTDGQNVRNIAASSHLQLNFGILPLISGIYDLARQAERVSRLVDHWNKAYYNDEYVDGQGFRFYDRVEMLEHPIISNTVWNWDRIESGSYHRFFFNGSRSFEKCTGHVKTRFKIPPFDGVKELGLLLNTVTNSIDSVRHEILPFSWLYDYFFDLKKKTLDLQNRTILPVSEVELSYTHAFTLTDTQVMKWHTSPYYDKYPDIHPGEFLGRHYLYVDPFIGGFTAPIQTTMSYYKRTVSKMYNQPQHSGISRPRSQERSLNTTQWLNIAAVTTLIFGDKVDRALGNRSYKNL